MSSYDRDLLLFIIHPTLRLIESITRQLIAARGAQFQDTSALEPLFKTFTVVCSMPIGPVEVDSVSEVS